MIAVEEGLPIGYEEAARDKYIEEMHAQGFVVMDPRPNELQIDIDSDADYARFNKSWPILKRDHPSATMMVTPSRSGSGSHIRVLLPFDIDAWQRIALQGALGSDSVRELISSHRLLRGDYKPTLLVETQQTASVVEDWLNVPATYEVTELT